MDKHDELKRNIASLLANIISRGEIVDFSKIVPLEEIPQDFAQLRQIYQAIKNVQDRNLPPTADNVERSLATDFGNDNASAVIGALLKHRSKFGNIEHLSAWIQEAISQAIFQEGLEEIIRVINNPVGTPQQRWERAITIWGKIQSFNTDGAVELDGPSRFSFFRDRQRQRWERASQGLSIGPSLKFRGFVGRKRIRFIRDGKHMSRDINGDIPWSAILKDSDTLVSEEWLTEPSIPILQDGDVTLITAEPKRGKSTIASILAEHNAYELGHIVLLLQLEIDQDSAEMRSIARDLLIPRDALATGHINPDAEDQFILNYERDENGKIVGLEQKKKASVKAVFDARMAQLSSRTGTAVYAYCPGWTVFRIIEAMRMMSVVAKEEGKKLLVIIDYYNKISRDGIAGDGEASTLSRIADHIKDTTASIGCHTIVFSQETPNDNNPFPFGSRGIQQKAQIHISLRRWKAWEDVPLVVANAEGNPVHVKDSIGRPIYWCKDTDNWDARAILKVILANDNPGTECKIMFQNAYFNALDCPKEYANFSEDSMNEAEKLRNPSYNLRR